MTGRCPPELSAVASAVAVAAQQLPPAVVRRHQTWERSDNPPPPPLHPLLSCQTAVNIDPTNEDGRSICGVGISV